MPYCTLVSRQNTEVHDNWHKLFTQIKTYTTQIRAYIHRVNLVTNINSICILHVFYFIHGLLVILIIEVVKGVICTGGNITETKSLEYIRRIIPGGNMSRSKFR